MRVFHLHTKSSGDDLDEWYDQFRRTHKCQGCGALGLDVRTGPIDVYLAHKPDRSALNVSHLLIGIIRIDFMRLFEPEFLQCLLVGDVLDRHGNPIEGFATFHSSKPIPIRSGPESTHRVCDKCGRFVYSCVGDEDYVMRDCLTGQPVYEAGMGDILLTEELYSRIDRKKWKGFWVDELPVRDTPLDGIDVFPENYY